MRPDSSANSSNAITLIPDPQAQNKRSMTLGEIELAHLVFHHAIDYARVKIHRGGWLGLPTRTSNAMTIRGEIYFPDTPDGYQYANDGAGPAPAYRYNLQGVDRDQRLPQFNMEQQGELLSHYFDAVFLTGVDREQQHAARVANLPALRHALSDFLTHPGNHELLPQTTAVEPNPSADKTGAMRF